MHFSLKKFPANQTNFSNIQTGHRSRFAKCQALLRSRNGTDSVLNSSPGALWGHWAQWRIKVDGLGGVGDSKGWERCDGATL